MSPAIIDIHCRLVMAEASGFTGFAVYLRGMLRDELNREMMRRQ